MTRVPLASDSRVASLTLNTYSPRHAWRGLPRMGTDHLHLRSVPGLTFYRLMGTGRGADLTLNADLRRWARFAVWSSLGALDEFEASAWRQRERGRLAESCMVVLSPHRWRGRWGGTEPFGPPGHAAGGDPERPVAVLTRAAIRPTRLVSFWRAVPASQQHLRTQRGLLASVGAGEVPLLHQATFSVWRCEHDMQAFAYGSAEHREVMTRTQREGWYREELFARFGVLDVRGHWEGRDLLHALRDTPMKP